MDYIEITDSNNNKKKMEVVNIFELEGYPKKYIIYKELDDSHYYLAKFQDNIEDLDTNFTNKEYEMCQVIFNEVLRCN